MQSNQRVPNLLNSKLKVNKNPSRNIGEGVSCNIEIYLFPRESLAHRCWVRSILAKLKINSPPVETTGGLFKQSI